MAPENRDPASTRLRSTADLIRELAELASAHDFARTAPVFHARLRELAATVSEEPPERRLRLVGKARKVSVSMPEDLAAAVQERVGPGAFSQYVTEAVGRQLELDLLGELLTVLDAEHGQVPDGLVEEARRLWPDTP